MRKNMKKKGFEWSLTAVAMVVMILVTLAIMLYFTGKKFPEQWRGVFSVGEDVTKQAKGEKCGAYILGQYCKKESCNIQTEVSVPGDFEDCKKNGLPNCCRKVREETKTESSEERIA